MIHHNIWLLIEIRPINILFKKRHLLGSSFSVSQIFINFCIVLQRGLPVLRILSLHRFQEYLYTGEAALQIARPSIKDGLQHHLCFLPFALHAEQEGEIAEV